MVAGGDGSEPVVDVVWNGIDDDVLDAALAAGPAERAPGRPRFVWLGRMSPEKRLLPFLEAVAESGIDARRRDHRRRRAGEGGAPAGREARAGGIRRLRGRLPYVETLRRIAAADAVVQTSIGFETQGMTVFEAASLGTPAVVSDPDIGAELGSGYWPVADASTRALAETLRTGGLRDRGGHRREARPVDPRAVPTVVAHGGDGRGLRPRAVLSAVLPCARSPRRASVTL